MLCFDIVTGCGLIKDPTRWQRKGCLAQIQLFALEQLHLIAFAIVGIVFLQVSFCDISSTIFFFGLELNGIFHNFFQLYGIIASILLFYHIRAPKAPQAFKDYRYERAKMWLLRYIQSILKGSCNACYLYLFFEIFYLNDYPTFIAKAI